MKSELAIDPVDIAARIGVLRSLQPGWLDGEGMAPSREGLDWFAAAMELHYPAGLPSPHLYPTVEGGVRAEWSIQSRELSLEINLATRMGHWHAFDLKSGRDQSRLVNLNEAADWAWVANELRRLAGASA